MVDILLSTYNGEKYLREQLDSLINQSYKDINIIVRDDCSTDNTCDILKEYKDKFPSIFELHLEKENKGCKDSFFELCKYSKNDYIMFCDQDDVWLGNKVKDTLEYMKEKENNMPTLIYTDLYVVDENLKIISHTGYSKKRNPYNNDLNKTIFSSKVTGMTCMINKKLLNKVKFPADENISCHDIWVELSSTICGNKYFLNSPTVFWRQHGTNTSGGIEIKSGFAYIKNGIVIYKKFIDEKVKLCIALRRHYENELTQDQKDVLENFIALKTKSLLDRMRIINKYKYSTGIIWHYLALILYKE